MRSVELKRTGEIVRVEFSKGMNSNGGYSGVAESIRAVIK